MYIPPPVTVPPARGGDGKTTLAPPGGCGRGGGGGRQRPAVKERLAEERARTLFRLQQTVASLSFSGTRRSLSPWTSSSSRTATAAPSSFPLPLFLFPPRLPRRPSPRSARVLRAAGPKVREAEENPGDGNSGQNVLGEKAKSCAQPGREGGGSCWWRRVLCAGPDAGLRRGFPSPSPGLGRGPRAGDGPGRGRGPPPPQGKTSHMCG